MLGPRARPGRDETLAAELFSSLKGRVIHGIRFDILPLRTGEAVLVAYGASSEQVSDSDALFDHLHPWMRPRPLEEAKDSEGSRPGRECPRKVASGRQILTPATPAERTARCGGIGSVGYSREPSGPVGSITRSRASRSMLGFEGRRLRTRRCTGDWLEASR